MTDCAHESFKADVAVNRLEDTGKFMADIHVACAQCGQTFRFLGLRAGIDFDRPTVSIDETELHAPIEPEDEKRLQASASFHVPERLKRH